MKTILQSVQWTTCFLVIALLGACGSNSSQEPVKNGGLDCFGAGATAANTSESSGVALFYDPGIFPGNTRAEPPWTFLEATSPMMTLTDAPDYNYTTCSIKYNKIIDTVIALDRNKQGTMAEGGTDSYANLRRAVATSMAPFVGLDTFYYVADNLKLSGFKTGLTEPAFKEALNAKCTGLVDGENLFTTGVCPNGTYMHNFLWRDNGLFTNNGSARFVGVEKSGSVNGDAGLTWTRGYLLKSYSNHSGATPFHTAIFDAGSSGTRLSFFEVTPSTPGGKATVKLVFTEKYGDSGINDFMSGRGTISTSKFPGQALPSGCNATSGLGPTQVGPCVLQPLLNYLTTKLPSGVNPSEVKIELFATAGMRTEDVQNGGSFTAAEIGDFYRNMKSYVATSLPYSNVGEFKTINGNNEEGLWTWINLNDLRYNTFATPGRCGDAPIANFEVGGSSMQVSFPTREAANDAANVYNVSINGCSINVFSKTYLGLGGDDARKFMRAYGY